MLHRLSLLWLLFLPTLAWAQMITSSGDTLFGHEWVQAEQSYYKLEIAEDGLYQIQLSDLPNFPFGQVEGSEIQLWCYGKQLPIYLSETGVLQASDYVWFYGEKNRASIDSFLFENPFEELLNSQYSLSTDTAAYFLTWRKGATGLRYSELPNNWQNPGSVQPYVWYTERVSTHTHYIYPRYDLLQNNLVALSTYDEGEGFGSRYENQHKVPLQMKKPYLQQPEARLTATLASNSNKRTIDAHTAALSIGNTEYVSQSFGHYDMQTLSFFLQPTDIHPQIELQILGMEGSEDKYSQSNVSLTYKRLPDANGASAFAFHLPASTNGYDLSIDNFAGQEAVLVNLTTRDFYRLERINDKIQVHVSTLSVDSDFVLWSRAIDRVPTRISPVTFDPTLLEQAANYFIITDERLYSDSRGQNPVADYAAYRESNAGGGYVVKVATADQLYDLFAYGVARHPLAVKNYINYVTKQWSQAQYVLLLGNGNQGNLIRGSGQERLFDHFVPTYGFPPSDHMLVSEGVHSPVPLLPVGRISAHNGDELRYYLDKLKTYEYNQRNHWDVEHQLWRKRAVHLLGGRLSETGLITSILNQMERVLENGKIGALVQFVKRESSDPVNFSSTEEAIRALNEGVLFKTFFGHGAVTVTDFGLDDPGLLDLGEKYPVVLSLGCLSGFTYDGQESVSERFVLAKDKGAIAYLATGGYGYTNSLQAGGVTLYEQLGGPLYGHSLGEAVKATNYQLQSHSSYTMTSFLQQWNLQGDPALRLHIYQGPDYVSPIQRASISPGILDSRLDSFELRFDILNIGKGAIDSIRLAFRRESNNGYTESWFDTVQVNATVQSFAYNLPVKGDTFTGQNTIYLTIDDLDWVDELPTPEAENNNDWRLMSGEQGLRFSVLENRVRAVQPPDFAIVSQSSPTLYAHSAFISDQPISCVFQIDTTRYFDSPIMMRQVVSSSGGSIQWQPPMDIMDSVVYYWRVSLEDEQIADDKKPWSNRSFVYIPGVKSGWNQSHFFQYQQDNFNDLQIEEPDRQFSFESGLNAYHVVSNVNGSNNQQRARVFINNDLVFRLPTHWSGNTYDQIHVTVIDPETGNIWQNPYPGLFGSNNLNKNNPWPAFVFRPQLEESRHALVRFLQDTVPDGFYVIALVGLNEGHTLLPDQWAGDTVALGTNLYRVLEQQGATLIRHLQTFGDLPYAIAYKKGEQLLGEDVGDDLNDYASVQISYPVKYKMGSLLSVPIGPVRSWNHLEWSAQEQPNDSISLAVYGLTSTGKTLLYEDVPPSSFDLSGIQTDDYPMLQLEWTSTDTTDFSAAHLRYWRVFYEGLPDLAIAPDLHYRVSEDTLEQGQSIRYAVAVQNIGESRMDSSHLVFHLRSAENEGEIHSDTLQPLAVGDTAWTNITIPTPEKLGTYFFSAHVNPERMPQEYTYGNNYTARSFYINVDRINPLLSVTFDGHRVMDGELVSAKPLIVITLEDENKYLLLSDTSAFSIELESPDGSVMPISLSREDLVFYPATSAENNEARIEWQPHFEMDGTYTLRVNGDDASANAAGKIAYSVRFEVIQHRSISHVLPYPNPFSNSCRFAYVLTGDKPPDVFKLQIMTVSGKVVREISKAEFGNLRVGKHLSDFIWDGHDQYGDPLANGVYLYRVITRNFDEDLSHYESSNDKFFKKDFGKLVILR